MVNEAVRIENGVYDAERFTCASGTAIVKGTLLTFAGDYTVCATSNPSGAVAFAGIAAADKSATDESTEIGAYHDGVWDIYACSGATIVAGQIVVLSGANAIQAGNMSLAYLSGGAIVGRALEATTAGTAETIRVRVGL